MCCCDKNIHIFVVYNEGDTGCDSYSGTKSVLCAGYPEIDCVNDVCTANPTSYPTTGTFATFF